MDQKIQSKILFAYTKLKTILNEKENNEYIISHRLARNILIEILEDLEKIKKQLD